LLTVQLAHYDYETISRKIKECQKDEWLVIARII
jgi:hypothetical protein